MLRRGWGRERKRLEVAARTAGAVGGGGLGGEEGAEALHDGQSSAACARGEPGAHAARGA